MGIRTLARLRSLSYILSLLAILGVPWFLEAYPQSWFLLSHDSIPSIYLYLHMAFSSLSVTCFCISSFYKDTNYIKLMAHTTPVWPCLFSFSFFFFFFTVLTQWADFLIIRESQACVHGRVCFFFFFFYFFFF